MDKNQNVQNLLSLTLNAEMSIRSITTKIQRIREAQSEHESYKQMLDEQMMENRNNEKNNIALTSDSVKKEEVLGMVVSSLEYLILSKHGNDMIKIEEEIKNLKELVDKIPSNIDRSIIFNKDFTK
jgi:hypothetical protein